MEFTLAAGERIVLDGRIRITVVAADKEEVCFQVDPAEAARAEAPEGHEPRNEVSRRLAGAR